MRALAAILLAGFVACACDSAPDDSTETATQSLTTCRPGFHRVCEPNDQGHPVCACERDDPPPPPPDPLCGTEGHVSCSGACVSRLTLTPSGICSRCTCDGPALCPVGEREGWIVCTCRTPRASYTQPHDCF